MSSLNTYLNKPHNTCLGQRGEPRAAPRWSPETFLWSLLHASNYVQYLERTVANKHAFLVAEMVDDADNVAHELRVGETLSILRK